MSTNGKKTLTVRIFNEQTLKVERREKRIFNWPFYYKRRDDWCLTKAKVYDGGRMKISMYNNAPFWAERSLFEIDFWEKKRASPMNSLFLSHISEIDKEEFDEFHAMAALWIRGKMRP